jgi:DNA-binding CsgD family transcriptional regulator
MSGFARRTHRPSDRELLRAALRTLVDSTGLDAFLAGLVDQHALTITELVGTRTRSLDRLFVQPGEGVGGGAMARHRLTAVADYLAAAHISHHHDEAVRREGLRSMMALPILVHGQTRGVVYAATRTPIVIGDRLADDLTAGVRAIERELLVRDEVDRRIAIIRAEEPELVRDDRDVREALRIAHGELVALASSTDDSELATRLRAITDHLDGGTASAADAPRLSRRELDVLTQVALGCSYPEVANRLLLQPGTVKSYMQAITAKLGVHSRHEAVATARRFRLIP